MELIEKYGGQGSSPKGKKKGADGNKAPNQPDNKQGNPAQAALGRTRMPPPPTANIQRRGSPPNQMEPGAEFAPNAEFANPAFPPGQEPPSSAPFPPRYPHSNAAAAEPETHWYDRIFDVLLGEDETAPKNRIVLICQTCRLVNGQAPPGTKALSELGTWKCMSCGALNGELDEGKRIVKEVLGQAAEDAAAVKKEEDREDSTEDDVVDVTKDDIAEELAKEAHEGPASGVRKRRGKGKK